MNKIKKIAVILLVVALMLGACTGCRQSTRVNYNISKDADNFKIQRRIIVWNCRTDAILFELQGCFALSNSSASELVVTCKTGEDTYQKNYIYLNGYTAYVVEDIGENETDPYHYELNIEPKMIGGVSVNIGS